MNYNEAKVIVHCQYFENYNVGPDGFGETPYWKPKGGFDFVMPIDSDTMFYADTEVVVQAIKNLVEKQNTIGERFEYIDYEMVFSEPFVVKGLEQEITKVYEMAV
jgi:hypothetical protein